jgi:hypothetical protein
VSRRRPVRLRRRMLVIAIAAPTLLSLAFSLHQTRIDPQAAYFVTPTRVWEFGAGALLALLPPVDRARALLQSVLSWVGLAAIAVAAIAYSSATAFPGHAALLPVLGALAVMQAGVPAHRWAPSAAMQLRPVQYIGDISYSVYLWHWPLIALAPFVIDRKLDNGALISVFLLTLLAASLSKRLLEDPIRSAAFLARRGAGWTLALAAVGTALVLGVTLAGSSYVEARRHSAEHHTEQVIAANRNCFGAAARDAGGRCSEARWGRTVVPTPLEAKRRGPGCPLAFRLAGKRVCAFGAPRARATATVVLIGDSHAGHWVPALDVVARTNRWYGLQVGHHGCPLSLATRNLVEPDRSSCARWKRAVIAWLAGHPEVRTVIVSQLSGGSGVVPQGGRDEFETSVAGYLAAWKALPRSVEHIVVIRDTPKVHGNTDTCVQQALSEARRPGRACAVPRRGALDRDPAAEAAARLGSPRVRTVDLTRFFCDRRRCYPVIGGALVFKDPTHLTVVYARSLAPFLRGGLAAAVRTPRRAAAARVPRCFGAAARDPRRQCRNPRRRHDVRPTPRAA